MPEELKCQHELIGAVEDIGPCRLGHAMPLTRARMPRDKFHADMTP